MTVYACGWGEYLWYVLDTSVDLLLVMSFVVRNFTLVATASVILQQVVHVVNLVVSMVWLANSVYWCRLKFHAAKIQSGYRVASKMHFCK